MALPTVDQQYRFVTVPSGILEMLIIEVLNLERLTSPLIPQRVVEPTPDGDAISEVAVVAKA